MVELIKKMFIGLLISLENASNHVKCISLSNQKYIIQPTLINLHPVEYSEELHYYPFAVKLGRCAGSCNTLNDLFNKACVPNKTEDLNLSRFNMITAINESETSTKHVSWECKCKFDGRKCNSNQKCNNEKHQCECIKHHICEKDYIWNPATGNCKNVKYLASIINDSVITFDEIIDAEATPYDEETKTVPKISFVKQNVSIFYLPLY